MINLTWQLWLGHGTTPRQSGLCSILAETEASIWSVVAKHVRVKPGLHLFVSQQQILLEMNSPTSATRRLPFLLWASVQSCQPGKKALPITIISLIIRCDLVDNFAKLSGNLVGQCWCSCLLRILPPRWRVPMYLTLKSYHICVHCWEEGYIGFDKICEAQ